MDKRRPAIPAAGKDNFMAKSKKTVEIPLVRSGAAVESGDVNFTFNNELIGSLSESGTAVLKTKDTIVRKDIEVEYTKPSGGGTITLDFYELTIDWEGDQAITIAEKIATVTDLVPGAIFDVRTVMTEYTPSTCRIFDTNDHTKNRWWFYDDMSHETIVPNLTAINAASSTSYNAIGFAPGQSH